MEIETLLPWSLPVQKETARGPKLLRTAAPTSKFWEVYKVNKEALKASGIGVSKFKDQWQVSWWLDLTTKDIEAVKEKVEASKATRSDYFVPAPEGLNYMPFQIAGIEQIIKRNSNILLGDEMGLGKSIQGIGTINVLNPNKTIIVVPASLKLNWKRELNKWLIHDKSISIVNPGDFWPKKADIIIINYDILSRYAKELEYMYFDLILLDEAHYIKNTSTKRAKATHDLRGKLKIALTGTPISNRPAELFSILHFLDPQRWNNFYKYAVRYCAAKRTRFGLDTSGASNLDELQRILRETVMIRRLKSEVLTELPPKTRELILIEQDEELARLVKKEREIINGLYDLNGVHRTAEIIFSEMARVRHEEAIAKMPYTLNHIREIQDQGVKKLVIFAHHRDVVDLLMEGLAQYNPVKVTGSDSQDNRQAAVDRFQNDPECLIFVGNIKAAGVGLTLTASSHVIFTEMDWVPANINQAEDRCHRIGQHDNVLVQHLVVDGSIDAEMAHRIVEKQNVIDKALDKPVNLDLKGTDMVREVFLVDPPEPDKPEKPIPVYSYEEKVLFHEAVKRIAAMDGDRARSVNGRGFNKFDGHIGHILAGIELGNLSNKQADVAMKLAKKYRNQLA